MKKYKIVTDVTNDLTASELAKLDIIAIPGQVSCDGFVNVDTSDPDEFYAKLYTKEYAPGKLKTGCASPGFALDGFEQALAESDPDAIIVYAATSEHITEGTLQSHRIALQICADEHPDREFIFCPTYCTSNGQALCLQYLARYTGDDIVAYAAEIGKHIVHLFTEREFSYSLQSGRYNSLALRLAARILELRGISPWMYFPSDDQLDIDKQCHLRRDEILEHWVDYYLMHRVEPSGDTADLDRTVRIGYAGARERIRAQKFALLLQHKSNLTANDIQLERVGTFVGAHTGPTCLSFFFRQKEIR